MEIFIYIIIGIIAFFILYKLIVFLKKKNLLNLKFKTKVKKEKKAKEKKQLIYNADAVEVVSSYMSRREVASLFALNKVLPKEYITLPKVGVANLLQATGNRNLYDTVKYYFIDFVVFEEKTMKPLLVIDIFDNSFEDELLKQRHPDLYELLAKLNLPVIEYAVKGEINLADLQTKLFDVLGKLKMSQSSGEKK